MAKKVKTNVRESKREQQVAGVAHDFMHQNSAVVMSRIRVARFEIEECDRAVANLQGALVNVKAKRAVLESTVAGLMRVLERRQG